MSKDTSVDSFLTSAGSVHLGPGEQQPDSCEEAGGGGGGDKDLRNSSSPVLSRFDLLPADIPDSVKAVFFVAYVVIIVGAVGGNGLVILVVGVNRKMKTVTNVFLVSLSASDALMALLNMPFQLLFYLRNEWTMGEALCKLTNYVQGVVVVSSILTLTGISMDRYYAICHPLKAKNLHTVRRACVLVLTFWAVSLVLVSPQLVIQRLEPLFDLRQRDEPRMVHVCAEYFPDERLEIAYGVFFYVVLYVGPLVAMFCAYGSIARRLWRSADPPGDAAPNGGGGGDRRRRWSERKRTVRMLIVIVVLFDVSWFPFFTSQLLLQFSSLRIDDGGGGDLVEGHHYHHHDGLRVAMAFLYLLAYSNSCINPIIYCFLSENFRQHFRQTLCCRSAAAAAAAAASSRGGGGCGGGLRDGRRGRQQSTSSDREMADSVVSLTTNVQHFVDLDDLKIKDAVGRSKTAPPSLVLLHQYN